jgi:hypothetical protein
MTQKKVPILKNFIKNNNYSIELVVNKMNTEDGFKLTDIITQNSHNLLLLDSFKSPIAPYLEQYCEFIISKNDTLHNRLPCVLKSLYTLYEEEIITMAGGMIIWKQAIEELVIQTGYLEAMQAAMQEIQEKKTVEKQV